MAVSANIGVYQPYQPEDTVVSGHHSPIYKTKKVKTGQGVLDAGLIVAVDSNGEVVPYDPAGTAPVNEPVGVLVERCDTSKEDAAVVLVHGTVFRDRLKKADGSALTADDEKALEAIGIYPMP